MRDITDLLLKLLCPALLTAAAFAVSPVRAFEVRFPDAHDPVPNGWSGSVFRLSQEYPTRLPSGDPKPWKAIDFRTQPEDYVKAVFAYVREGNESVDWVVQDNPIRRWYHAPWMHYGDSGREFIRGLTRERTTPRPPTTGSGELGPQQASCFQNWAVSFFNPVGGYQIGRIWADPLSPNTAQAAFPDGTVAAKLLFSAATVNEVPYLAGALEWEANVSDIDPSTDPRCQERIRRNPQKVRLLQIDLAVRDDRADSTTGWVFATMSYDGSRPGASALDRMVPVGLMWGNDPALTPQAHAQGKRIEEGWINPANATPQHLGWLGRLNGPVDNPRSSCLSCHATAQTPVRSPMIPPANASVEETMRWFKNIKAGDAFDTRSIGTDYSLQISMGIQNFRDWRQSLGGAFAPERTSEPPAQSPSFTSVREAGGLLTTGTADLPAEFELVRIGGATEYRVRRGQ